MRTNDLCLYNILCLLTFSDEDNKNNDIGT